MAAFQHILFPVDFSERSKALCPYIQSWVNQFHAKLTLLNVVGIPLDTFGGVDRSFPVMFDYAAVEAGDQAASGRVHASTVRLRSAQIAVEEGDPRSSSRTTRASTASI